MSIVICDLDGTLVQCEERIHFIKDPATGLIRDRANRNWPAFHEAGTKATDFPNVKKVVNLLAETGVTIHILTGRPEPYRVPTEHWLFNHGVRHSLLLMRKDNDFRSDIEFKAEVLDTYRIADVLCILEDRDTVVHMARTMGFTVFQVANGAF